MDIIKAPRGVRDVLPDESWKWAYVMDAARKVSNVFGYSEVHLPILNIRSFLPGDRRFYGRS